MRVTLPAIIVLRYPSGAYDLTATLGPRLILDHHCCHPGLLEGPNDEVHVDRVAVTRVSVCLKQEATGVSLEHALYSIERERD